ncbi:isoamylase 1, chloroplastic [Triticum aestivum]|uniref:isoamylase 1, chloroplastic n=1 Tax=Triticum aestivum TaxID=4565 RepID=UPI001D00B5BE|nr:isoamylase 1, chloroplastic-like [Triticum aestivum]
MCCAGECNGGEQGGRGCPSYGGCRGGGEVRTWQRGQGACRNATKMGATVLTGGVNLAVNSSCVAASALCLFRHGNLMANRVTKEVPVDSLMDQTGICGYLRQSRGEYGVPAHCDDCLLQMAGAIHLSCTTVHVDMPY